MNDFHSKNFTSRQELVEMRFLFAEIIPTFTIRLFLEFALENAR